MHPAGRLNRNPQVIPAAERGPEGAGMIIGPPSCGSYLFDLRCRSSPVLR